LLQLIALAEQKLIAAPAPVAMLASPRPYHNLPQPTYTQFVGRDEEMAWLRQRLAPDDPVWQIAITGIGGVGKSALALAIAHECRQRYNELPPEERFEAIVWVSAKEEVLTAFGEPANVPGYPPQRMSTQSRG
jgi:LuxR family glucitol operon transcriptional activator